MHACVPWRSEECLANSDVDRHLRFFCAGAAAAAAAALRVGAAAGALAAFASA
jgi:hypothetical protein